MNSLERRIDMGILETATEAVIKRPSIIVTIGVMMLAAALANSFFPVIALIIGVINMAGGGIIEGIMSVLQMLIDPGNIPTALVFLAAFALLAAIIAGLLLPGYLLWVGDGIEQGEKTNGLFIKGLKSNFLHFFFITVITILAFAALSVFLMIAGMPAVIVTKAVFAGRQNLMIAAVFIDIVTAGALFMCLSFFRAYIYMWYMAAAYGAAKPFKTGKSVADLNFWRLTLNLTIFDIVFAAAIYGIYLSENQIFRYIAGWVFTTGFFAVLAVYLVRTYRESSIKYGDSGNERTQGDNMDEIASPMR